MSISVSPCEYCFKIPNILFILTWRRKWGTYFFADSRGELIPKLGLALGVMG